MVDMLRPCSEKQAMMLNHDADVLFIGGACGGGKTHIMTMIACRYLDDPNYRATFLRRNTPQLMKSGNLWDKGHLIFGALPEEYRPRWLKGEEKVAIFPNGAKISYSHMQLEKDKENFQGAEMTGFFIDEAKIVWSPM